MTTRTHHKSARPRVRALAVNLAALSLLGSAFAAAPGNGNIKPYVLSAEALIDVAGTTDLTVSANVVYAGFSPPTRSAHIQMKSFDTAKVLRWTKNSFDVALTPASTYSWVRQSFTDMAHGQSVNVFAQVQNAATTNKENLYATAAVKFRPDITVSSVEVPAQAMKGQVVNISSLLKELKGDLGATTKVTLQDGPAVIDTVTSMSVLAAGSSSAVFTAVFDTVGVHTLTITSTDVNPGDYDSSNNSKTVELEVIDPAAPLQGVEYYAGYSSTRDQDYEYNFTSSYGHSSKTTQTGDHENMWVALRGLPLSASQTVLEKVVIDFGGDGVLDPALHFETTNVSPHTWNYLDNNTYIYCYQDWWANSVTVEVGRWASQYVYFSVSHDATWGESTYTYTQTAVLAKPATTFNARVVVTSEGQDYGGNVSVPLFSYPYADAWDYTYTDYYYSGYTYRQWGHNNYVQVSGYSSGTTTP